MIETLYGKEVTSSNPLPQSDVRVREIAKRAKGLGATQKENELTGTIERDMDTIDEVVGNAWNRKNKTSTGMPVTEKNGVHLQIRNNQYRRETPERRAAYHSVTEPRSPNKSEYDVQTEWTVTVNHAEPKTREVTKTRTNAQGETETYTETEHYTDYYTTSYEMSRRDTLKARYEEVLANQVNPSNHIDDLPALPSAETRGAYAVSASNGSPSIGWHDRTRTDWILSQGSKARGSEAPYRDQISQTTKYVDSITNDAYKAALKQPGETKKILSTLQDQERILREKRESLANYLATNEGAIQNQWAHDRTRDFKDRNEQMLSRYDHIIKRVVHLAEQVRREVPSLTIEHDIPNYEPQMQHLREIRNRNYTIIGATSATAAVGTGAAVYYQEELMNWIRSKLSNGDR